MSSLIDRYIHDVSRRLPEKQRADVERELRSNILDMLPDDASDEQIRAALLSLGDPAVLAAGFRRHPNCLISPALFGDYVSTLKIAVPIVALAVAVISLVSGLIGSWQETNVFAAFGSVFGKVISGAVSGVIHALFWITAGFAAADYYSYKKPKKEWSPETLPEIPSPKLPKLNKAGVIAETLLAVLFYGFVFVVFTKYPHILSWMDADGIHSDITLFDSGIIARFAPFYLVLAVFEVALGGLKLWQGRWSYGVAALHCALKTASSVLAIVFLQYPGIFRAEFIQKLAQTVGKTYDKVASGWNTGLNVLCALIVVGTAVEIIETCVKAYKTRKYTSL